MRIIRACRDEGISPVVAYADADRDALFVRLADEAHALGGDRPAETYLDAAKLIAIARRSGADAVHPGYGFLSERAEFARAVQDAGLIWVGPDPEVIEALGDKIEARRIAESVGAPLVAGSPGPVDDRGARPAPSPRRTGCRSRSRPPSAAAGAASRSPGRSTRSRSSSIPPPARR